MPIEIKELHIKINVNDQQQSGDTGEVNQKEKDRLIAECVEHVMEILSKKEER